MEPFDRYKRMAVACELTPHGLTVEFLGHLAERKCRSDLSAWPNRFYA